MQFTAAIRMAMSETKKLSIADVNSYVVYFGAGDLSQNNLKLHHFDLLILDPDEWSKGHVSYWKEDGKIVVAYLSIGTAENWRWYWPLVEEKWKIAPVDEWPGEWYIDCRKVGWRKLILNRVIPKILSKGFHGLFLDNIDVAELYPKTASGVVRLVREIKSRYPSIILIANNGLCVMSKIWKNLDGLVKEDVSSTYDWNADDYVKVPLDESNALLKILASWKKKGLEIFVLDYAVTKSLAKYDYERARRCGLIPYAANIMLDEIYVWESNSSCDDNYVITSYWTVHEKFYSGEKIAVKDGEGEFLGYYRLDFIADVKVEGWGKGDGAGNDGEYLGYDPSSGFMKSKEPLDAYGQPLIPWLTVSADPSIPKGTEVTIKSLGSEADVASWVAEKLLTTTFVVSDRGPSVKGHHIDVYVGDQTQRDMNESPVALYIRGATVCVSD